MLYALKLGPMERSVLENCAKTRRPLPEAIRDAPELFLGLEFAYSAFWTLCTMRPIGLAPAPIPWSAIAQYARHHELEPEEAEELDFLISKMDQAYLEFHKPKEQSKP